MDFVGRPSDLWRFSFSRRVAGVVIVLSVDIVEMSLIDPTIRIYLTASFPGKLEK